MVSWHGNNDLRAEVLARMRQHRAEDSIIQGDYQVTDSKSTSGYRGCLIGCTLPERGSRFAPSVGWHGEVERLYGVPRAVGHLMDHIFEGLPKDECGDFATASIYAIRVGSDLSLVAARMMVDILADTERGVWQYAALGSKQRLTVRIVTDLYRRKLANEETGPREWYDAARTYAYGSGSRAATEAVEAATSAAVSAYASALTHAAFAASAGKEDRAEAIEDDFWRWCSRRLLTHLMEAPMGVQG